MQKLVKRILIIAQIIMLAFVCNSYCQAVENQNIAQEINYAEIQKMYNSEMNNTEMNNIEVKETNNLKTQDIDYIETIENFNNPERGFYDHFPYKFSVTDNKPINSKLSANLIHLRLDIGEFSKAVNGKADLELSQDMLDTFDAMLKKIKSNGGTAIVRFAYDEFRGKANLEPSLDMILRHIEQLCPVFNANQDVIAYIELGFFGPYGEMHTSKISSTENVSKALDVMLDNTVDKIKIGVRTPNYYAKWLGIDRDNINENITQEGTREYRVGLFNDGYLGSGSDLGTFKDREKEITWLENQALHTLYGGEVVANYGETPINTTEYISKEGFRTHTTYLNSGWNDKVIKAWKEDEIYNGEDEIYKGQSGYLYIANHLGYRYVLRNSALPESAEQEGKVDINLDIENVGFGNLVNEKVVTIVLENGDKKYEIKTDLNPTKWNSQEITKANYSVNLPKDIELGEWKVYLRISQYGEMEQDNNYLCIRMANNDVWNEEIGANYIGKINVVEKQAEPTPPTETTPPVEQTPSTNPTTPTEPSEDQENPTTPGEGQDTNKVTSNNNNKVNGNKNSSEKKDNTTSNKVIPQTGKQQFIIEGLIVIFIGLSIFFYKKSVK